ncbi:MAG TPA: SMP-30/gluconolactonase/LRE family protein [Hypericibacter adhaerens]|uniref:ABC transporter permease n=1 Tax=Hypericibacter adhaerens TaxID=2602016 RepID=UPI002C06A9D7|nr:SMP-30/gluconolactonase/LRE family protein [Hypericibacter adhaerens]HWA46592.1 SMP-30/gluconolactonase/LRE family protein [Hypericibacter adhaerens]
MSLRETAARLRYKYVPDHLLGEILSKNWIDNTIPFLALLASLLVFSSLIPDFLSLGNLTVAAKQLGEFTFVTYAMAVVMIAGGIDLSVGSNFALGNFTMLVLMNVAGWPAWLAAPAAILVCALVGLLNGWLIGYLRLRAFLTTLATLIIVRSLVDWLLLRYSVDIVMNVPDSPLRDFLADGIILYIPVSFWAAILFGIGAHIFLSRTRPGWHIMAIGGSRKSAYNVGISVRRTICLTYVASGALCGVAGALYAARLGSAGSDTGVGMEIMALTAAVLGGNSLGGGRGSVAKAIMGAIIVLTVTNGLVQLGLQSGASSIALGFILLLAIAVDVRWLKNRHKLLAKVYLSPAYLALPPSPSTAIGSDSPFALNDKLKDVDLIGLGQVEGPEDVIFDRAGNLYCGTRQGDIMRFPGPDHRTMELFAHVGGWPLGLAFDKDENLLICVGGMGLYGVRPNREVFKLTDETNRTRFSIIDDSRLRIADDLDIAPDGRVFFSEATVRYEAADWVYDAMEGRGNGRIVCYDPRNQRTHTVLRNLVFPNGVCLAHDGKSILFSETWGCRINRYWLEGPKAGTLERLIAALPGYPDNINRASDGTYWLALVGMRTPSMDLALQLPGFRRRMTHRVSAQELLFPNINTGCVVKFDDSGRVLGSLWDQSGQNHPMITSMREHQGHLYLGGLLNNRIGKYRIPGADPDWTGVTSYWGTR